MAIPKVLPFPMLQNPPIIVADISRYQASNPAMPPVIPFDFSKYQAMGGQVIILRSGVGASGVDYQLSYNLDQCAARGIPVILYHYTKLWHSLDKQAALLYNAIELALSKGCIILEVYLDIEANDDLDKTAFTSYATKLVNKIKKLSDEGNGWIKLDDGLGLSNIGIYTRAYFWNGNTYRTDLFKHLPLWVAHHYSVNVAVDPFSLPSWRPFIPDDWAAINNPVAPTFWQFDTYNNGEAWGSNGDDEIDLNWYTWDGGTYESFEKRYGVKLTPGVPQPPEPPEPPEPPIPPVTTHYIVDPTKCRWLNGREEGVVEVDNIQVTLRAGQKVTFLNEESGLWKKVRLDNVEVWMHGAYLKAV